MPRYAFKGSKWLWTNFYFVCFQFTKYSFLDFRESIKTNRSKQTTRKKIASLLKNEKCTHRPIECLEWVPIYVSLMLATAYCFKVYTPPFPSAWKIHSVDSILLFRAKVHQKAYNEMRVLLYLYTYRCICPFLCVCVEKRKWHNEKLKSTWKRTHAHRFTSIYRDIPNTSKKHTM